MAMTYTHRRSEWEQAAYPMTGPAFSWSKVDLIVIHYPGGGSGIADGDPGDPTVKAQIQAMQRDYKVNRGYSLGYSVVVDYKGESWEARGDTYQCAANKYVNARSFAIQLLVDRDDRASDAAVAECNRLIRQAADHIAPRKPVLLGHYQTTMPPYGPLSSPGTSCPGIGIKAQLASGTIRLLPKPGPPPTPTPPPTEEVDVLYICKLPAGTKPYAGYYVGNRLWARRLATYPELDFLIGQGVRDGSPLVDFASGNKVDSRDDVTEVGKDQVPWIGRRVETL